MTASPAATTARPGRLVLAGPGHPAAPRHRRRLDRPGGAHTHVPRAPKPPGSGRHWPCPRLAARLLRRSRCSPVQARRVMGPATRAPRATARSTRSACGTAQLAFCRSRYPAGSAQGTDGSLRRDRSCRRRREPGCGLPQSAGSPGQPDPQFKLTHYRQLAGCLFCLSCVACGHHAVLRKAPRRLGGRPRWRGRVRVRR